MHDGGELTSPKSAEGCAAGNLTAPQLMNPSFEHPYGLEHWDTSPLSDGIISVVTDASYEDNYAHDVTHSIILPPIEGPGFDAGAPGLPASASVGQRLRVCPGRH